MVKGKPVDEHAPKRPLSGYFLFAADVRSKVTTAHPKWAVKDVMSEIGKQWSSLAEAKKKTYNGKAEKDIEAWKKKMEKHKKTAHYAKFQKALGEWKKAESVKPFKKDPNRPKRAMSAYMFFVNEKRPGLEKQGVAFTDVAKRAAEMWGKLSDSQKVPYDKKAAKAKAEAAKAVEKYEKTKQHKEYMAAKEAYDVKRNAAQKAEKAGAKSAAKDPAKK